MFLAAVLSIVFHKHFPVGTIVADGVVLAGFVAYALSPTTADPKTGEIRSSADKALIPELLKRRREQRKMVAEVAASPDSSGRATRIID
jgi:hypothetical protein